MSVIAGTEAFAAGMSSQVIYDIGDDHFEDIDLRSAGKLAPTDPKDPTETGHSDSEFARPASPGSEIALESRQLPRPGRGLSAS